MRSTQGPALGRYPQMPVDARGFRTLRASGVQTAAYGRPAHSSQQRTYKPTIDVPVGVEWVVTKRGQPARHRACARRAGIYRMAAADERQDARDSRIPSGKQESASGRSARLYLVLFDSDAAAGVDASICGRATVSAFADDRLETDRASGRAVGLQHHDQLRAAIRRTEGRDCFCPQAATCDDNLALTSSPLWAVAASIAPADACVQAIATKLASSR